jgi:hypothetical protein
MLRRSIEAMSLDKVLANIHVDVLEAKDLD